MSHEPWFIDSISPNRAGAYFTADDDGLTRHWSGRIWLNPPHSQPLIGQFVDKLICEVASARVESAIMLTPNRSDGQWIQRAAGKATVACFPRRQIRFRAGDEQGGSPRDGQCFHSFGPEPEQFAAIFGEFGALMAAYRR